MSRGIFGGISTFLLACLMGVLMSGAVFAQDGGNTDESDDDFIDDDSVTEVQYTDNSEDNDQFCAPVVNQYNNIIQGGANVLAGGDAVAAVANQANVSNEVVINCINGDNNSVGGGDTPDNPTDPTNPGNDNDDDDDVAADRESSVINGTVPDKVLANTGGDTGGILPNTSGFSLIPVGALLLAVSAMLGVVLHGRSSRRG